MFKPGGRIRNCGMPSVPKPVTQSTGVRSCPLLFR